jgi:hypothetical protein
MVMNMKRQAGILMAALLLGALAAPALARSLPGYAGKAYNPGDVSCFTDYHGSTNQTCSTGRYWFVQTDIDDGVTAWNANIMVYRPNTSTNVGCSAWGVSSDQLTTSITPMAWASNAGSLQTLSPGWVSFPSGTRFHMFMFCYMDQGTQIANVNW